MTHDSKLLKSQVIYILCIVYISSILVANCGTSYDAYWHIKVGEWIIENKTIPTTGIFSYTKETSQWISHEWLSELIMYIIFNFTGWKGLVLMTIISITSAMLLMTNHTLKYVNTNIAIIFVLMAYLLLITHIMPRPHILALPFMVFWVSQLVNCSDNKTTPPLYTLAIMILWSNMHGSFILGIACCFFFASESIFYANKSTERFFLAKKWGLYTTLSTLSTLVNPHFLDTLLLPLQLANQDYTINLIQEWSPPDFSRIQAMEIWLFSLLSICFTFGFRLPLFRMFFILGLIHLSLKHVRHSSDLLSLLPPLVLAQPLAEQLKLKRDFNLKQLLSIPKKYIFILSILIAILIAIYNTYGKVESENNILIGKILTLLTDEKKSLGNVLNSYETGGNLIHYNYQTFIDSRAELYGDDFIKYYFEATNVIQETEKLKNLLQKYKINWTIFETKKPINSYFETNKNWSKIYQDNFFTVYIKDSTTIKKSTLKQLVDLQEKEILLN